MITRLHPPAARCWPPCDRPGRERGSASLLVIVVCAVALVGGTCAVALGELAARRAALSSAADMAALAAASRWWSDVDEACGAARRIARENGATLTACTRHGPDVDVEVAAPPPHVVRTLASRVGRHAPELRMSARAGPAPEKARLP